MENYIETISNIAHLLLPVLLTIFTPVLVLLARIVVKKLTNKLDAETKAAIQDMVNNIVGQGVAFAEQYTKTQEKVIRNKIDSSHKLEMATIFVVDELRKQNLPELSSQDIQSKIESYLGFGTLNNNLMTEEGGDYEHIHED
jgi:hypothetical protein